MFSFNLHYHLIYKKIAIYVFCLFLCILTNVNKVLVHVLPMLFIWDRSIIQKRRKNHNIQFNELSLTNVTIPQINEQTLLAPTPVTAPFSLLMTTIWTFIIRLSLYFVCILPPKPTFLKTALLPALKFYLKENKVSIYFSVCFLFLSIKFISNLHVVRCLFIDVWYSSVWMGHIFYNCAADTTCSFLSSFRMVSNSGDQEFHLWPHVPLGICHPVWRSMWKGPRVHAGCMSPECLRNEKEVSLRSQGPASEQPCLLSKTSVLATIVTNSQATPQHLPYHSPLPERM